MIKKYILLLLITVMVLNISVKNIESINVVKNSDFDLSFSVLSDIHKNLGHLQDTIEDLNDINPHLDALVLNGDTVDEGLAYEYDEIKEVLNDYSEKLPKKIIKNIGNHEWYEYRLENETQEDVNKRLNMFLEFAGRDKIYSDNVVKGYHFITLGADNSNLDEYRDGHVSNEELNWFKSTLEKYYEEGKPMFVFIHEPLEMHLFTINKVTIDKHNEIRDILKKYSNVILFTSHTHLKPNENYDKTMPCPVFNTGSVTSNYVEDLNSDWGFKQDGSFNNGLYVEVKDNKVTIKARNFKDKVWIYEKEIF